MEIVKDLLGEAKSRPNKSALLAEIDALLKVMPETDLAALHS
jgi:hypothetical protein